MAPKKQVQKMSLGDFLGDQSMGSWADEMEDMPIASESRTGYGDRRAVSGYAMTTDRGYDRGPPREQLPLPTKPPFTAHLGNLPYDATSVDAEEFFAGCSVTSVRLVEDKAAGRPKGFGYVEFGTLDGLKKALELNGAQFRGRNIKVSVADPPKDRGDAREITDWSRKGPLPELPQQQRRASERNFGDGGMRRGYEPPDMERGGSRRGNMGEGDGRSRDFSNWERKGPLSPAPGPEPNLRGPGRVRNPEGEERRNVASWGEGRSQEGSRTRPEVRDRPAPPERKPTAAEQDTQWRAKMRPDPPVKSSTPTPDPSTPSSPAPAPALAVRPKLNLAKRTVSEAQSPATPDPGSVDAKASPFGAARPIDTATREKEVEEKRLAAIEEKKVAEEKAREEKKAQEAAAKEAAAKEAAEKPAEGEEATNGAEEAEPSKVTVLSRPKDNEDAVKPKAQAPNGSSERPVPTHPRGRGAPREPREPREPRAPRDTREPREPREGKDGNQPPRGPRNAGNREWRKPSNSGPAGGSSNPGSPATPSAGPDDDGWSTVPAKQKGGPKGRGSNTPRTAAS